MWLLENKEAFQGRRLWLRPGKTYLFGRTAAEPGQLVISHSTISRQHLTITVGDVEQGHAHHLSSRSKLTIEDLATKIGTFVDGQKLRGSKHVVEGEAADLTMGKCPYRFRILWLPVIFTFSFTKKELQTEPLTTLRERFEQLDVKLLTDYNAKWTTHVVSKKRNTAKGLQALINSKYIVDETFLDAIVQVAEPSASGNGAESSALESDFDNYWPDAMQHLPPRGGEPVQHPDSIYKPDSGRKEIFDGYTFIFYDQTQYDNLLAPITNASGKALLENVIPGQTQIDDFVTYVKNVAGEKGLGAFDDGSEGKGVVLVRYLPAKGSYVDWYTEFVTAVSLRLDHRPIEQSEFLEAILIKEASILRRPLEVEPMPESGQEQRQSGQQESAIAPQASTSQLPTSNAQSRSAAPESVEEPQPAPGIATRRTVKRRFVGFDDDVDIDMDEAPPPLVPVSRSLPQEEEGLFVPQEPDPSQAPEDSSSSRRKRPASSLPEDDLMDGMAPAAARLKRQRLERGETLKSSTPEPAPESFQLQPKKKIKKEFDILAMAAQNREEEEARARAEKEDLANLPDDVDLSEIRRLNIVEEMEIRQPVGQERTREKDIADGRWNPKWNGMKNFKKFRRRGEATGRQPVRVIVPLTEVKNKEFGVGDDYWLEDGESQRKREMGSQPMVRESQNPAPAPLPVRRAVGVVVSDDSDEGEDSTRVEVGPATSRKGNSRAAATQSQSNTRSQASKSTTQSQGKRPAPEPIQEQPAKRQRPTRKRVDVADSDESDDDLKFRFGKRR